MPTTRRPDSWTLATYGAQVAGPARCLIDAARGLSGLQDLRALLLGAVLDRLIDPDAAAGHAGRGRA